VLVTGATGFIGHYLLAELLKRGVPCAALLRPPLSTNVARLASLLRPLGVSLQEEATRWRLAFLEGELNGEMPGESGLDIRTVLHAAGVTTFEPMPNGEPRRTNVTGTAGLLAWAQAHGVTDFHLVSSAYRCGDTSGPVLEKIDRDPPVFLNAYEQSKWESERLASEWAERTGGRLTVYRPSIVVGDQRDGRTTSFSGFYVLARANEVLSRWYGESDTGRFATGLRISCGPEGRQDMVPVDYVATMIAHAVADPAFHGKVYHITHPNPPRNATIRRAIDEHFGFAGSSFIADQPIDEAELSGAERVFYESTRVVRRYLSHHPVFDRTHAESLQAASGARCGSLDVTSLRRLIGYAQSVQWGRCRASRERVEDDRDVLIDRYFTDYLPRNVAHSRVAQLTAMTTTMRFVISDVPGAPWVCGFDNGRLVRVRRTAGPDTVDFTYTTTRKVFWRAIAGEVSPQDVFLQDMATVTGDVEAGIKMAVILHRFNHELPCTPEDLRVTQEAAPCYASR
jgi:nucleoside-diphosphate-sugar epimerase